MSQIKLAAGVDIGATKVAIGIVDNSGRILGRCRFEVAQTPKPSEFVARIANCLHTLSAGRSLDGVGIGCPGPMDLRYGVLLDDATLPQFYGVDLVPRLRQATGLPVWMENDADAALLGETWVGSLREVANAAMLTIGTGLGGAAIVQGRLLRGHRGMHPEVAALRVPAAAERSAEEVVAGPAIALAAKAAGYASAIELLESDSSALRQIHDAACQVLWNVLHLYAPEVVLFGGGVMEAHFARFAPAFIKTARNAYFVGGSHIKLLPASLGNDAGMVGAARMILDPAIVKEGPLRSAGPSIPITSCPDIEAMSREGAQRVLALVRQQPDALICIATGTTPQRMYELLALEAAADPKVFAHARIIKLDEWQGIRNDLPGSCEAYIQQRIIKPWRITPDRYTAFVINPADPQTECRRIAEWLAQNGPMDLAILGVGLSGHIGFNEPAEAMTPGPHVAALTAQSLSHAMIAGERHDGVYGLTLGVSDLLRSRAVLLLAAGTGKRRIMEQLAVGEVTPQVPVSMLHLHPRVTCLYVAD